MKESYKDKRKTAQGCICKNSIEHPEMCTYSLFDILVYLRAVLWCERFCLSKGKFPTTVYAVSFMSTGCCRTGEQQQYLQFLKNREKEMMVME